MNPMKKLAMQLRRQCNNTFIAQSLLQKDQFHNGMRSLFQIVHPILLYPQQAK